MDESEGFPPLARTDAQVLILGSLPGQKSLADQEYYAHPQNAFWKIMQEIYGIDGDYAERCEGLVRNRVALWDVLRSAVRPGSMDADISTPVANDFITFLNAHPDVSLIAFNGRKAEQLFRRMVKLSQEPTIALASLPSTSPAYASLSFSGKLHAWRQALSH